MATPRPERSDDDAEVVGGLHDLEQSLIIIAGRTRDAFETCDGLGITLQLETGRALGHSNAFAQLVDAVQYGLMEGPCLQAQSTGSEVRSTGVGADERRWPRFTEQAAELGLRSVVSAPLLADDQSIGSLNLYGATEHCFSGLRPEALARVAGSVAQELRSPELLAHAGANARWFVRAVQDRADVEGAVRVLMDRYGMSRVEGQVLIQQLAHEDDVSEVVAARTVIDQDSV